MWVIAAEVCRLRGYCTPSVEERVLVLIVFESALPQRPQLYMFSPKVLE